MRVLCVVGTRPEAIKMAPVIAALRADDRFACRVCATGQHREMLHQALACFGIEPDIDLDVMVDDQGLNALASTLFAKLDGVLRDESPDMVIAHGDTTTAMVTAVSAFQRGLSVGHVEAGLRTGDLRRPWPEEMNRRVIDVVARELFAPTELAKAALTRETLPGRVTVTGNTVVDALRMALERLGAAAAPASPFRPDGGERPLILATCHRRENFGGSLDRICEAIEILATDGFEVVLPVHRNPNVRSVIERRLQGLPHVQLVPPLDYLTFVDGLRRAAVVLTDSGGVQEEAASLGKPLIVMRDVTERPEAMATAHRMRMVGSDPIAIVEAVRKAASCNPPAAPAALSHSPYGDGWAAARIAAVLAGDPVREFAPASSGPAGRGDDVSFAA